MQTEGAAKRPTNRFFIPPITIEFEVQQYQKAFADIHVRVSSGKHCFVHRQIKTYFDHFGEIPVVVSSSLMNWLLWFVQFEAQRREADPAQRRQLQFQFPSWPAPDALDVAVEDIEF